jgi:peptidoglycan/xylan/chitin deacetylase (PgdA/CDA1 family)
MPRALMPMPNGKQPIPDIANFSWVEYGLRAGVPRLMRVLREAGIPVSAAMNSALVVYYPQCAEAALEAGWEVVGHGVVQRSLREEPDEEAAIVEALGRLEAFCGWRPQGWLGPAYGESLGTPDLLKKHGIEYLFDWTIDDVPCWMTTETGPLLSIPYMLELNDVTMFLVERQGIDEFVDRYQRSVACFEQEAAPRLLTIALHPHLIGVPHRIGGLRTLLEFLAARDDTVFMTGGQIRDWYVAQVPPAMAQRV